MLAHAFLTIQRAHHLDHVCEPIAIEGPAPKPADTRPPIGSTKGMATPAGAMIRLTVTAIAGLLAPTGLATQHTDAHALAQHHWRVEHQTAVAVSHYQRRGDPLPPHLQTHSQNRSQRVDLLL